MRVWKAILAVAALLPVQGSAQTAATLVADRVEIGSGNRLIASGRIEILHNGDRIKAEQIIYDPASDTLSMTGPIVLTTADGNTVLFAQSAELSQDLRNGVLSSARMVLDQQLQLAAAEINRVDGRYTQLYKTVASSCQVCAARPVPLWQIRAKRVIHDAEAQQLYFHNARFEVAGLPILYLPRLRFPDPTLDRATGFLAPKIRSTDSLGFGIKIPYFIRIGDHKDLTLTPYLSSGQTRTLEARYRQSFRNGDIVFNMAMSRDDIRPNETRGYFFGSGAFGLRNGYILNFDIEGTSDPAYLLDYDYSDKDRLDSAISLSRARRGSYSAAEVVVFDSLRDDETADTSPKILFDAEWRKRLYPAAFGGRLDLDFAIHSHLRRSDLAVDGPDADLIVDGRDVGRVEGSLEWRRGWVSPAGLMGAAHLALDFDHTVVTDDASVPDPVRNFSGSTGVEFRWPLQKTTAQANHILEPVVQLLWTTESSSQPPNDESTLLELDDGNLFSFSRFPGGDRTEQGLRANLGLSWTRYDPNGWSMGVTVGRIVRQRDLGQFAGYSSLSGTSSDWLAAVYLDLPGKLTVMNRALFDNQFEFNSNELRMTYNADKLNLGTSYIWMEKNTAEERPDDVSELTVDAAYRINENWRTSLNYRFDFEQNKAANAELGLEYRNECVTVDLSLSRRFTSSTSVNPTTDFGLSVSLAGFGTGAADRPKRRKGCSG